MPVDGFRITGPQNRSWDRMGACCAGRLPVMIGIVEIACVIAALLLSLVWLLTSTVAGWSAPSWVGPAGLFAAALALAIGLFAARRPVTR